MSEKKNIVIKVKYPASGQVSAKPISSQRLVTEWNYKRIAGVVGGLFLVAMALAFFSGDKAQKATISSPLVLPEPVSQNNVQPEIVDNVPAKPALDNAKAIVRHLLTRDIERNEPVDTIKSPLKISKKETLWIYYFVELKGMRGKVVYHEWLLNRELVSHKKVNISSDSWRTASKQMITYTMNNDWQVRLVDESGNKLSEESFGLELK